MGTFSGIHKHSCFHVTVNVCVSRICAAWTHSITLVCATCSRWALSAHGRREKPSPYITSWIENRKEKNLQSEKEERNTEWGEGQEKERLRQQSFFSAIWRAQRKMGMNMEDIPPTLSHLFLLNAFVSSFILSLLSPFLAKLILTAFLLYALLWTVFLTNTLFSPLPCDSVILVSLHPPLIRHLSPDQIPSPSSILPPLSLNTHNHPSLRFLLLWDTFSSFFQLPPDSPSPSPHLSLSLFCSTVNDHVLITYCR